MKNYSIRAISLLLSALILVPFLAACGKEKANADDVSPKITAINMFYQKDTLELAVNEKSAKMHITVTSTGDFSREDIEFVSDDKNIATVNYESTLYTNFIYFTVVGIGVGDTDIYFKSKNSDAVSDKIHVSVHEPQVSDTSAPAADTTAETTSVTEAPSDSDTSVNTEPQSDSPTTQATTDTESTYVPTPNNTTVYVTPSGTKYHYSMSCAGKNAIETSLNEARLTHEPCKKCVGDSAPTAQEDTEPVSAESYDNDAAIYEGTTVYITPTGKKYHLLASCAGKNAIPTTLENASKTYEPCKKCAQ